MVAFFLWIGVWLATASPDLRGSEAPGPLDCATHPCAEVLPSATRFEAVPGKPYVAGYDGEGEAVGWVALSTDLTAIKGYSAKPIVTLVGLATDGTISGARVVHHSEPILLVGIPESTLDAFVKAHIGVPAEARVVVGGGKSDAYVVDIISGATVTVLAESQTIMETARPVAEDAGVIEVRPRVPGHWLVGEPWSWTQLQRGGALGRLTVTHDEMGVPPDEQGRAFVDMVFAVVDAPQVGVPLLGESTWKWATGRLEEGEHLFVIFNAGSYSFKGSGFVRGGLFDRFHVEQGMRAITFRDMDYTRLGTPPVEGAPEFWEGGLFVARSGFDPGQRYAMSFLGSSYALERGAFERDFKSFSEEHRVPRAVYQLDGPDPDSLVWRQAWALSWHRALFVGLYLGAAGLLFVFRGALTARMKRLQKVHLTFALTSFFVLGLGLHVQPSVTQVLTLFGSAAGEWDWGLFLSDPELFVSWILIALTTLIWGRGVFCGWVCPYGALAELQFKVGRFFKFPNLELPDAVHNKLRYVRYGVFFGLLGVFLWDSTLGEQLAEVEPFKSTFFVPFWTRHPALAAWWLTLFSISFTTYRPFCRYLCPLGAALALPSSIRLSSPYRRDFCTKCKICARGCEPRAIRPDGSIDPRECLNCWECEANWGDETVCPPLVKIARDRARSDLRESA